jgi:azurin
MLASVLLAACGQTEKTAPADKAPNTGAAAPVPGARTLQVMADDAMKFNVALLEAKAGESLRLILTNIGKMPKQAMAHNWVLLKPCNDTDFNAFGMAATMAAPTYIPAAKSNQIVVQTKLLGPGESDTIEFKAPAAPGDYPFLCTFPGHFALMKGKLVVK